MSKKRQKRQARRARRTDTPHPTPRGERLTSQAARAIEIELTRHTLGYYPIRDEEAHYLYQLGLRSVTR